MDSKEKVQQFAKGYLAGIKFERNRILGVAERLKRVYEDGGSLAGNPAKWEISVTYWNGALQALRDEVGKV